MNKLLLIAALVATSACMTGPDAERDMIEGQLQDLSVTVRKYRGAMYGGDTLRQDESLVNGTTILLMQGDCNLVMYSGNTPFGASGTRGKGTNCHADMQKDGNFVVYTGSGAPVWSSQHQTGQLQAGNYVTLCDRGQSGCLYLEGPYVHDELM